MGGTRRRVTGALVAALALVAACEGTPPSGEAPRRTITFHVVDESGAPVTGVRLDLIDPARVLTVDGTAKVATDQPVAGVASAAGYLPEPVVIDPEAGEITVELLARVAPDGTPRTAFHFGGDVMMGRRYQTPAEGSPTFTATDDDSAVQLVSLVSPLMRVADASMVNLETVVGNLSSANAYPGKRFLLQSPPAVMSALTNLGIDLVTLGNNHANDWQGDGVASTIEHLDAAGIPWVGAGGDEAQAEAGRIIRVNGLEVGVVSATTVNGDFVNDNLPRATDPVPDDLLPGDEWQYERRPFRFRSDGEPGYIAPTSIVAGDAWSLFEAREGALEPADSAALWDAITEVFPELQDWVARRGHGGAAMFSRAMVAEQIAALRAEGAALVIVQIHGGFQFSDVPSEFLRGAAHAAIDAGADLVVGHHPHVLQGFEWYQGRLIAYSLGNFLFDQDFLSTFPSVMLRTVFEGDRLLEARVVPLVLDRYRPVPATGEAAERILREMNASSLLAADSDRLEPDLVTSVLTGDAPTASLEIDRGTALVVQGVAADDRSVTLDDGDVATLDACSVIHVQSSPADLEVGVDLLGWGSLGDATADGTNDGGAMWVLDGAATRHEGGRGVYLYLEAGAHERADARQVARSTVPAHRWYTAEGEPADADATYTVRMRVRRRGDVPRLSLALYDVNDTDPTVEPSSTLLHTATVELPATEDGEWETVSVDVTSVISTEYGDPGVRPEALLLSVIAPPGDNRVDIDDVRLYEWRAAAGVPAGGWTTADALRSQTGGDVHYSVSGCAPG